MRSTYLDVPTRSIVSLDQTLYAPDWMITRVSVLWPHRGKGFAGMLLRQVVADADADQVTLWLHVQPDVGGLSRRQLTSFYRRYGFESTHAVFSVMCREPTPPWDVFREAVA